jgi:hypothetical protein
LVKADNIRVRQSRIFSMGKINSSTGQLNILRANYEH